MPKAAVLVTLAFVCSVASLEAVRGPYSARDLARSNHTSAYQTGLSSASKTSSPSLSMTSGLLQQSSPFSTQSPTEASTQHSTNRADVPNTYLSASSSRSGQGTQPSDRFKSNSTISSKTAYTPTNSTDLTTQGLLTSTAVGNTNSVYVSFTRPLPKVVADDFTSRILNYSTSSRVSSNALPLLLNTTAGLPSANSTHVSTGYLPRTSRVSQRPFPNISNGTRLSTGYYPHVTAPYRPTGQVHYRANQTCGGATVNIVGASLDWWYTETYTHVDSTFVVQFDDKNSSTAWTLLPATQAFDITTAVANPTCVSSTGLNPAVNQTEIQFSCIDTAPPTAAATTTVEQTAYKDIEATTSRGEIPDVVTTPTPAAITVADDSATYSAGTPFVHFSKYEVVSKRPFRYGNGVGCVSTTRVHTLESAGSFEYTGGDVDGAYAAVAGDIHQNVLGDLGEHDATAGSFVAEPTVVVVVEKIVAAARLMRAVLQPAQQVLEVPTATLPPGMSDVPVTPTEAGTTWAPVTAHIEETASELAVPTSTPSPIKTTTKVVAPFVAHVEGSDITLAIPVDRATPQPVVTAIFNGATVTATAIKTSAEDSGPGYSGSGQSDPSQPRPDEPGSEESESGQSGSEQHGSAQSDSTGKGDSRPGDSPSEESQPGGNVEKIISAIVGAARPPNAAQVLSNAELTFSNPVGIGQVIASVMGQQPEIQSGQRAPVLTIGSSTLTALAIGDNGDAVSIGGQTLSAGGPPITIDGTPILLSPGATEIEVGSSTIRIDTVPNPGKVANIPLITVGSNTITANAATQFNVDGEILTPGGAVTVSGTTVSLEPNGNRIIVNGKAALLSPPAITPAPLLTFDGTVYQPNIGMTYDINSQFLTPGGAITVAGMTISLPSTGTVLFINGLAQPTDLSAGADADNIPTITAPPVLSINGNVYIPNPAAAYLISSQTLTPGGLITYTNPSGAIETLSLDANLHTLLHISASQTSTSLLSPIGASPNGAPLLTIHGKTYAAVSYSPGSGATYLINGQTLTAGGSILYTLPAGVAVETISLLQPGTAIAITDPAGHVSTSTILGAYAVMPTSPPLLTLGGETFTAMGPGATYVIDGQTLVPGGDVRSVVVDGRTFVVGLAAQATALVYSEVGSGGGSVTAALFPARMTGGTFVNDGSVGMKATQGSGIGDDGARATSASSGDEGRGGVDGGDQNTASGIEAKSWVLCVTATGTSLFLAIWL